MWCQWVWVLVVTCTGAFGVVSVSAQFQLPPDLAADLYSFPPGPWVVSDNSSTVLPSKRNSTVVELGVIVTFPGGPHGYRIPPSILGQGAGSWCLAAGYAAMMMDTNESPDILPNHRLQLVFADDSGDPAKAIDVAEQIYSGTRSTANASGADPGPIQLVIGSLTMDISRSIGAVARAYNRPFVSYWTDSSLLPASTYPTLVAHAESYDTVASALAQFVHEHGWERVATLTTLAVDVVAYAAHFSKTCASLGISVSSREAFDESLTDPSGTSNPSLDAAVARLKASDVRIMFLGCQLATSVLILEALDRAGMMGDRYVYLGDQCVGGAVYSDLGVRKPHIVRTLITTLPNTLVPDHPQRVTNFHDRMVARYKADPESMMRCDPNAPFQTNLLIAGYQFAQAAVQGLHLLHNIKQQCQQPDNQQRLNQALPIQVAKNMPQPLDCATAMRNTIWNTSLAIDCCRLDPSRSVYYRPPDPFGDGSYVNGDGPVLLDALRSVRYDGVMGPIGIQRPEAPVANLGVVNLVPDPATGISVPTIRQVYRSSSCNITTNICAWNITSISPPTFGDGTTTVPDDGVIRSVNTIKPSAAGRGVLLALAVLGMLVIAIVSVMIWTHRDLKSIKSSSITFVMLILVSAMTCLSTVIALYSDDSTSSCIARVWLGHLSFTVLFGSLLLKTYRLAHIFDNRALRVKARSDRYLLGMLAIYVSVVCAILISWMVQHAPAVHFKLRADGRAGYETCSSGSYVEMWVLLGIHAAALLWGIYLCVKSQDVFAELNESKQIASSIYNVALLSALIVAIDQGLDYYNVDITFYIYAAGIILGCLTTVALLVTPKLYDVYRYRYEHKQTSRGQPPRDKDMHTRHDEAGASELGNAPIMTTGTTNAYGGSKRSSIVGGGGGAGTGGAGPIDGAMDSGSRVSDMGLDMTAADWMKLSVFARKLHEATQHNNIDRVMVTHNQVHAMLLQIYQDAHNNKHQRQQSQAQPNQAQPPLASDTPSQVPCGGTGSTVVNKSASITSTPIARGRGSVRSSASGADMIASAMLASSGIPLTAFNINEQGTRLDEQGAASMSTLMAMHQHNKQQQWQTAQGGAAGTGHRLSLSQQEALDMSSSPSPHVHGRSGSDVVLSAPLFSSSGDGSGRVARSSSMIEYHEHESAISAPPESVSVSISVSGPGASAGPGSSTAANRI